LFTLLFASGFAWWLEKFLHIPFGTASTKLVFGATFVSTSTAVILKTLTSRGRMGTLSSKVMIGMSIVQDLTVIPIFLLVSKLGNLSGGFQSSLIPLVLLGICIFLLLSVGGRIFPWILDTIAKTGSQELYLLAAVAIALLSGLFADCLHVSFSFGAFLAGIALSRGASSKKAISAMTQVRDLFAMLFFVSIGMMLDVRYLGAHFGLVILIMFLTSISRTGFLAIVTAMNGFRNVIPFAMFFGMFATSEIAFVLIEMAKKEGVFTDSVYSLALAAVVCSMLLGPIIDGLTSPVYKLYIRIRND